MSLLASTRFSQSGRNGAVRLWRNCTSTGSSRYSRASAPISTWIYASSKARVITATYWSTTPPKVHLSELVNSLKGVWSWLLKKEILKILSFWSVCKSRGILRTPSYFAGSVGGAPLSILKQYIEKQGRG